MDWISPLEKRFGSWAIPNLAAYLVVVQAIGAVLLMSNYVSMDQMILHGSSILHRGEWWRLVTFMMIPKTLSPIWLFFALYIFYLMGSALEGQWGAFRFNLFIGCGYLLTVAMALFNPGAVISNFYFLGCVLLAFATLFPNFEFMLFFILPVKVKWLGWLTLAFFVMTLFQSSRGPAGIFVVGNKLGVVAALVNYVLFFGPDLLRNINAAKRRKEFQARSTAEVDGPRHRCASCGITEKGNPSLDFRYCSTCGKCFCEEHIANHDH